MATMAAPPQPMPAQGTGQSQSPLAMKPIDLTNGASPNVSTPDPSPSNPNTDTLAEAQSRAQLTQADQDALMLVRRTFKESYAPKRMPFIRRCLRAFEVLKNNPYILYNEGSEDFDTLTTIMSGIDTAKDVALYQYNDNIYQMLCLSFIAALSPDVPRTRYAPTDAEDEEDIRIAQKASLIRANNERKNGIEALQKLELLYLWCCGGYFAYVREIVDENRAGVSYVDQIATANVVVFPDRYICPQCGETTPDAQMPISRDPSCPECKAPLGDADWHEKESLQLPLKVGEKEVPNSMTAENILCGLNIDMDPEAQALYETDLLDYEGEMSVSAVRAAYPERYLEIKNSASGDDSSIGEMAKSARLRMTSPGNLGSPSAGENQGTYSRCWMQPKAFYILDDKAQADRLKSLFPKGVKLVTFSGNVFLEATSERLMDHWTWCPSLKGLGAYPFGVGDAALDVQQRINDCANTVHAYMDRLAFGTILADADYIDVDALASKKLMPGGMTPVVRTDDDGQGRSLEDLLYQPQFHIDSQIFAYGQQLLQLIQLIAGVQPQVYGGSDKNVQTAQGQAQMLKTAMGRMKHYIDMIHEERAARAKISVKCTVDNMDDDLKMVVEGDVEGNYEQEVILRSQLTGDFMTYPQTDEGFPSTYEEIQARLIDLLGQAKDNPFIQQVLSDPDTQKVVARYILPDEVKLATDAEITRLKTIMHVLSKGKPSMAMVPGPQGPQPTAMPSILPSRDYDVMPLAVTVATNWLQTNWQTQQSNPGGFDNVLAFLKISKQYATEDQIQQQLQLQAQAGGGAPPKPGGAPAPAHA